MDITNVAAAVITLLSAVVSTFLIPWLRGRVSDDAMSRAAQWIRIAVQAAEQIYLGPGRGEEKKRYVLELLSGRGIQVDERALEAILESEVLKIKEVARV